MTIAFMLYLGILLVATCIGWGHLIVRLVLRAGDIPKSIQAGIGFGAILILGGILNFFEAINKTSLSLLVSIGIGICIVNILLYLYQNTRKKESHLRYASGFFQGIRTGYTGRPPYTFFVVLFLFLCAIRVVSMVAPHVYNLHDDLQGYMVFPEKMVQTGSMQTDPFSERRIVSSIGGKAFIDSLVLMFSDVEFLHFVDRGFGFSLFLITLYGVLSYMRLKKEYILSLLFIPVLMAAPMANITAIYSGSVLFVTLAYIVLRKINLEVEAVKMTILFSIGAAGLCALKTSFIPVAGLFVLAYLYINFRSHIKQGFIHMLLSGILVFLCILPYMLASYSSSGTLLYPLLGKGFHGSAQGQFLTPTSEFSFTTILNFVYGLQHTLVYALFVLTAFFGFKSYKDKNMSPYIVLGLVGVIGALGIGFMTAGFAISHYTFAFLLPVVIILLAGLLKGQEKTEDTDALTNKQSSQGIGVSMQFATIVLGILIGSGLQLFILQQKEVLGFLYSSVYPTSLLVDQEKERYMVLQASVPEGETILVRLNHNYALDFRRNTIYIADYPGGSSLPPGMPFFQGPEALVAYLESQKIYFIAYSYRDQAYFTKEEYGNRLDPSMNAWIRTEAQHTFDFQDNLKEIGDTYQRIYDDGIHFVVDLRQKVQ